MKVLFALFCFIKLIETAQQSWDFSSCDAVVEYGNNTLKLEKNCDNDLVDRDALYAFFLYRTDGKIEQCQWINIDRQYFSSCETQNTLPQGKIRAVFEHIYGGAYCLAVYRGKWTSSMPVCKTEEPYHLKAQLAEATELDVKLWNPKLVVQQHDWNLLINLGINHSDGYNFQNFLIEIYKFNKDIGDCNQLQYDPDQHFEMSAFDQEYIYRNLTYIGEGYYCVQVTPDDPRCIFPHSVTYLPCTRSSNITRITLNGEEEYHWIYLYAAILFLLIFSATTVIIIYLKRRKERSRKEKKEDSERLLQSIFLLHSNEEEMHCHVQELKKTLMERLSSCEIEDYTDPHQWENVATEDVNWFLSRLKCKDNYIIVIPPTADITLKLQESSENSNFFIALKQLQKFASTPEYQRILTVAWLNNPTNKSKTNSWIEYGNPFHHFQLPEDMDLLINTLSANVVSTPKKNFQASLV